MTFLVRAAILMSALGLSGCILSSPPPRIYILGNPASAEPVSRTETGRTVIEVKPVTVPDYQDTRDILVRTGANELVASSTGRWADRLSVGITRALTATLAQRLPNMSVTAAPSVTPATWQVVVDVDTFEIWEDGPCLLGASWSILRGQNRQPTTSDYVRFAINPSGHSDAAIAAAMTDAVIRLADQIAAALSKGPGPRR
jgi:uncharacterized lipoprotein YmbA